MASLAVPETGSRRSTSPHLPAHAWSYRVPSPPRIVVPPPLLNASGFPDIRINEETSPSFEAAGFANTEFLRTVTYGDFVTTNNIMDWRYEERRKAQAILPFLYLGPLSAARDRQYLQNEGITMVLAVRNTMSAHARLLGSKAPVELGIQCHNIDVTGNQELIAAFPVAVEAINAHLSAMYRSQQSKNANIDQSRQGDERSTPGKVLVFCESGNERSAGVVAAYIMAMYSIDLIKSIQLVQAQRFCVSFDDPLKTLLQTYESILRAKRDVAQWQTIIQAGKAERSLVEDRERRNERLNVYEMVKTTKRSINQAYDMDTDSDDGYDGARFEARPSNPPFEDQHMA
ncbi:hypothetical protein MMC20_001642 [Loxospora ochrophaea]|nr:hypothetical protein [Loxospora ochrophaea]